LTWLPWAIQQLKRLLISVAALPEEAKASIATVKGIFA